jgi:transposase
MQYAPVTLSDQPVNGLTCGIDWARDDHAVAIVDSSGRAVYRGVIEHSAQGLADLTVVLGRAGATEVAIERPDGPVVDALLDAGLTVVVINPNQVKNLRSRYGSAGNKDDRFDAFVLADTLRTDRARLRPLTPNSPETAVLRALVRARRELVIHRVAVANQLREHLKRVYPGPIGLFDALDSPISLKFLTRFDCQDRADWLTPKRLGAWLATVGYRGRTDAAVLHTRLTTGPRGATGIQGAAHAGISRALVATLSILGEQIALLAIQIGEHLATHADAHVFTSLPRSGTVRAARLLAEIGTAEANSPPRTRWHAWPASRHQRGNPAKCAPSVSAGPATNNSATQSATSPTTPATPTPGPPISTTAPAPADTTTPTPPACWPAPGSTSSGAAGRPTPPMTPADTEPSKPCSHNNDKPPLDTGLLREPGLLASGSAAACTAESCAQSRLRSCL